MKMLGTPRRATRVSRALCAPKIPKKSEPQEVWKSPEKSFRDFFQTFRTFSRLFPDFLGPRGRRPRQTFSDFFWDFGPGGLNRFL